MIMLSKISNFPDQLSENDELTEYELSGSDCMLKSYFLLFSSTLSLFADKNFSIVRQKHDNFVLLFLKLLYQELNMSNFQQRRLYKFMNFFNY